MASAWPRTAAIAWATSGRPASSINPLSSPPTRCPSPPARIAAVMSAGSKVATGSALLGVAHQAAAFLYLPFAQFVLAPGERVFAFAELDADRRAFKAEALAKEVLEIAPVAFGDMPRAAAVDYDARRVGSARMGEAQLRRVPAHQRRL